MALRAHQSNIVNQQPRTQTRIRHAISRTCPVCGTSYLADLQRLKHGRQSTCSRDCSYKLRASLRQPPFFVKTHKHAG